MSRFLASAIPTPTLHGYISGGAIPHGNEQPLQPVLVRIRGPRPEEDEERTQGAGMPPDRKVCLWEIAWPRQIWPGKGTSAKISC